MSVIELKKKWMSMTAISHGIVGGNEKGAMFAEH